MASAAGPFSDFNFRSKTKPKFWTNLPLRACDPTRFGCRSGSKPRFRTNKEEEGSAPATQESSPEAWHRQQRREDSGHALAIISWKLQMYKELRCVAL
mmetsp:Transcript_25307/g.38474  ORF Transcript_25307/g.38474 Transcript_25307/m.38474 type:complete len:98 (-) Transcript_25307:231-524(-)